LVELPSLPANCLADGDAVDAYPLVGVAQLPSVHAETGVSQVQILPARPKLLFTGTRLKCAYFRHRPHFSSHLLSEFCHRIGVSFLLRCPKLQVGVLGLFDFERFAVELIEASKHGRTAPQSSVIVLFDG
jgi:hypothetical protein